jgi:hypothetical protein
MIEKPSRNSSTLQIRNTGLQIQPTIIFTKKKSNHILPCTESDPIFLQESQRKRAHNAKPNHKPTRLLHLLVVDHARGIPGQMPQAVERVVRERHGNGELGEDLEGERPGREAGGEHGALEVPADGGRDEVEDAEGVEAAGEGDAGDTVERRAVPGDLRLVDAEVGSDGAVQALLCEDLVVGWGGCGVSVGAVVSGRKRSDGMFVDICLPALCGEGGAHGNGSRSCEPAGRCLGGHWEVVSMDDARSRTGRKVLTPPQGLLCNSLGQHGCAGMRVMVEWRVWWWW